MDKNIEFLNYIYQNSKMGEVSITEFLKILTNDKMREVLKNQLNEYRKVIYDCDSKLQELNKETKGLSAWTKISTYIMLKMNTMTDKSGTHIAEMMIQGSTMGIIDITKKLSEYDSCMEDIKNIALELKNVEQKNVDELKQFIG